LPIVSRQELQSEITSRRPKIESLTTTAGLMMRGLQADSEAENVLQDELQEIKDRWNHVNEQVMELRLVIMIENFTWLTKMTEIANIHSFIGRLSFLRVGGT